MYSYLISQKWKRTFRSGFFSQGIGVKLLLFFMMIYFGGSFLLLGIFLPELLGNAFPNEELLSHVFASFFLYYLLMDLSLRFFLQELSVISIRHYLILPIKKSRVVHFLLQGSIFSFFNLVPLFFLIPFAIKTISSENGTLEAVIWFCSMFLFCLSNHYLAIYVKRILAVNQKVFMAFAALVIGIVLADAFQWFSLRELSKFLFAGFSSSYFLIIIPIASFLALYFLNFKFLIHHTQLDLWTHKNENSVINTERFSFIESKGAVGQMLANELKLIIRNKRTKSVLFMNVLVLFFGLYFYLNPDFEGQASWYLFCGIFMTGMFLINYGQFLIGWEGAYFDGILTRSYSLMDFFKAKFLLMAVSCVISYILISPYIYFGMDVFLAHSAAFLFNLGFNSFFILFAATYNKKKIDLSQGSAFNYQGTSTIQFLIAIPTMVLPFLIFISFKVFWGDNAGFIGVGAFGLLSLAFSKLWLKGIVENFKEKKYINAAGFREKS